LQQKRTEQKGILTRTSRLHATTVRRCTKSSASICPRSAQQTCSSQTSTWRKLPECWHCADSAGQQTGGEPCDASVVGNVKCCGSLPLPLPPLELGQVAERRCKWPRCTTASNMRRSTSWSMLVGLVATGRRPAMIAFSGYNSVRRGSSQTASRCPCEKQKWHHSFKVLFVNVSVCRMLRGLHRPP
jgi:hypothetical protein